MTQHRSIFEDLARAEAWRCADTVADASGMGRLGLRRTGRYLEIDTAGAVVRLGPTTLRVVSRLLASAAEAIEREGRT